MGVLYKPLIKNLQAGINGPLKKNWLGTRLEGVEEAEPVEDDINGQEDAQILQARIRLKKGTLGKRHQWRKECRSFESATKQRLPGGCSITAGTIRTNGMEVLVIEPFT